MYSEKGISKSKKIRNLIGVPEGSILGPLFFIIYVNDFIILNDNVLSTQYADDTNLTVKNGDINILIDLTNELLEEVNLWCIRNRLQLNSSKTQIINFNLKNVISIIETNSSIICDEIEIEFFNASKVLGVHIDKDLKWESHINELCKKLSKALFVIRSLQLLVHVDVLKHCYFAYFHSLLIYGLEIWGHAPDYLFQKVFRLQQQAMRLLCNDHYRASCRELNLFEKLKFIPLLAFSFVTYKSINL